MTQFRILDASNPDDKAQWLAFYERWQYSEVTAHPDYVQLFTKETERALCACYGDNSDFVIFPMILRSINNFEWADMDGDWCDLVSPYGYSGPFVQGNPNAEEFWDHFDGWVAKKGVVSLFVRLSLFGNQLLAFRGNVEKKFDNVIVPLSSTIDTLWREFDHKVRKNVNRAKSENLRFVIDPCGNLLSEFLKIYYETMERRGASIGYYFPESFFSDLTNSLPNNMCYFHIFDGDKVASTELVLISAKNVYSFLGGTSNDAFAKRPNDLLKFGIIKWAQENKKEVYVLGGGYEPDDGIFRYKRSFSPRGVVSFFVGKRIFDQDMYDKLVEMRCSFERGSGRKWQPSDSYFPAYRA